MEKHPQMTQIKSNCKKFLNTDCTDKHRFFGLLSVKICVYLYSILLLLLR